MKAKDKKKYIEQWIKEGDPRSYNELAADLELQLWHRRWKIVSQIEPNNYDTGTTNEFTSSNMD